MNPEHDRAPDATNTEGRSGHKTTPIVTADKPKNQHLGCLRGCPIDHHECDLGEPLADLPEPGPFERAGRDLELPELERIGQLWLEQGRAA